MVASEQHLYQAIVQFDKTILLPRKPTTGSIQDYIFWLLPPSVYYTENCGRASHISLNANIHITFYQVL